MATNHGAFEWIKVPDQNNPGSTIKKWVRDSWSRRKIVAIEGAGYQTSADVSAAIAAAIGGITELEYLVVSALPASGTKGVIYLVPHQHGTSDIYDEYIWVNNTFEKIGNTDVDLSQYLLKTDIATWAKQPNKPTYTASEVGALPDTTPIPSKTSDLTNDSGYITGYTETDPTVPAWAKAASKPSYTASEVGALPSSTVIPTKTSDLTNDSGFITGYTETDPTVPTWAKAASKPSYTASEVGALPDTTVIPAASSATPAMDGTGAAGSSADYARADHVHPHDTSKQDALSAAQLAAIATAVACPTYYGTCTTAAATGAKVVTCPGFVLSTGARIAIAFTNAQTYGSSDASPVTFNINGTGAVPVMYRGTTALPKYFWNAGQVLEFVYDGTNFVMTSGGMANTNYYGITKLTTSLTSTNTAIALTASAGKALQDQIDALSARITALGG